MIIAVAADDEHIRGIIFGLWKTFPLLMWKASMNMKTQIIPLHEQLSELPEASWAEINEFLKTKALKYQQHDDVQLGFKSDFNYI